MFDPAPPLIAENLGCQTQRASRHELPVQSRASQSPDATINTCLHQASHVREMPESGTGHSLRARAPLWWTPSRPLCSAHPVACTPPESGPVRPPPHAPEVPMSDDGVVNSVGRRGQARHIIQQLTNIVSTRFWQVPGSRVLRRNGDSLMTRRGASPTYSGVG